MMPTGDDDATHMTVRLMMVMKKFVTGMKMLNAHDGHAPDNDAANDAADDDDDDAPEAHHISTLAQLHYHCCSMQVFQRLEQRDPHVTHASKYAKVGVILMLAKQIMLPYMINP